MKKQKLIVLILVIAVLLTSSFFAFGCNDKEPAFAKAVDSDDGYAYVRMPQDRELRILQVTDMHLETWMVGDESLWNLLGIAGDNASSLVLLEKLLSAVNPDLVVLSGDMVRSWTHDNLEMYARIAEIIEEKELPWMPMFGNHDSEYDFESNQLLHAELASELAKYPYCLMSDTSGAAVGEYFVNIKNSDNDIIYTLCAMGVYYEV
ncbi:MAG: metallophosphoesterase [Bacillota bacterium]